VSDARPRGRSKRTRILLPALLFVGLSGGVFTLAELHLARPGVPKSAGAVVLGDQYQGGIVFSTTCASCHGEGGKGGGVGPRLAGSRIPIARVKAQIDAGGGTMPAALVTGTKERDVLGYVATILASR
jgi:mono/diheme cytochrome c family protein